MFHALDGVSETREKFCLKECKRRKGERNKFFVTEILHPSLMSPLPLFIQFPKSCRKASQLSPVPLIATHAKIRTNSNRT
jgi:hypothetical protein